MVSLEQFKNIPSVYLMQANVCTVTIKRNKFKDFPGNSLTVCPLRYIIKKQKENKGDRGRVF